MSALPTINPEKTMSEAQRMNPEIKARWVAALRSGRYRQADGVLKDDTGAYCCLGVLCNLNNRRKWERTHLGNATFVGMVDVPPTEVAQWAGFKRIQDRDPFIGWKDVKVTINGQRDSLMAHNDAGRTFAEIADAIEEQL